MYPDGAIWCVWASTPDAAVEYFNDRGDRENAWMYVDAGFNEVTVIRPRKDTEKDRFESIIEDLS